MVREPARPTIAAGRALAVALLVVAALAAGCARRGAPEIPGQSIPDDGFQPGDLLRGEDPPPRPPPDRPFILDPLL